MKVVRKVPIRNGYMLQVTGGLTYLKYYIFDAQMVEYVNKNVQLGDFIFVSSFTIWGDGAICNTLHHKGFVINKSDIDWSNDEMNDYFYAVEE